MDVKAIAKTFFDKGAVASKIPPANRQALSKFGAAVRRIAQQSLQYRDGASAPGLPPHAHRSRSFSRHFQKNGRKVGKAQPTSPLRELLFFGYDADRQSVFIGPALGGSRSGAPDREEHGGTEVIRSFGRRVVVHYPRRPFMQPAFDQVLDRAAGNYKNLIR